MAKEEQNVEQSEDNLIDVLDEFNTQEEGSEGVSTESLSIMNDWINSTVI